MSGKTRFAYTQARLQARHGMRPDEQLWHRLESLGDPENYLQVARQSTLRPWVRGLHAGHDSHRIELTLRRQYRDYIDEVARWLPGEWITSIRWLRHLADLPALQHLLSEAATPAWMLDDNQLQPFVTENIPARLETLQDSDYACLVNAWQRGSPLYQTWFACWQKKWPANERSSSGLKYLGELVLKHLLTQQPANTFSTLLHRQHLAEKLQAAFRRYSFQPAACCAHLLLVALDITRLRGDLVHRILFRQIKEAVS